ncbi:MAG: hypothetical protein HYV28_01150 [Ignavibacteriales bacterium]|nr:hypothetical protein [Ignavibacteriales bacterium]
MAVLFVLLPHGIFAQTSPQKFSIIKNNSFLNAGEIQQLFQATAVYGSLQTDSLRYKLARILQNEGYFYPAIEMQITLNENADSVMELRLNAGERSKLHSIQVTGAVQDDLLLMQDILAGSAEQHFSVALVAATLDEILKRFINSGYPFAAFNSRQVHTGPDSLHVTVFLEFVKGRYCTIDEVAAQGNTETKSYVIARQSRMLPGTVYNQSEIDKIKSRVMRLRLFSEVSDPQYVIGKDAKGILIIGVKEKNNNTFDGIVGFMPGANADEKGYFTGMANIQMRNLFGTGRGAAIRGITHGC